jgi:hypothetical protein
LKKCGKREYNPDMTGDGSTPEIKDSDDVGDSFPLEVGVPTLVGSSEDLVKGSIAVAVDGFDENGVISKHAIQFVLLPDKRILVSRPKIRGLYVGKNEIFIRNKDKSTKQVEYEYCDLGVGAEGVDEIYVGDVEAQNYFSLSIVSEDKKYRVKLNETVVDGTTQ